jgi:hypothetical protein
MTADLQLTVPLGWVLIDPRDGRTEPEVDADFVAGIEQVPALAGLGAYALLIPVLPVAGRRLDCAITVLPLAEVEGATGMDILLALAGSNPQSSLLDRDDVVALRLPEGKPEAGDTQPDDAVEPGDIVEPNTGPVDTVGQAVTAEVADTREVADGVPWSVDSARPTPEEPTRNLDPAEPAPEAGQRRSVRYILGQPGTDNWIDIHCQVSRTDDDAVLADATVRFFDEWLKTVKWSQAEVLS